MEARLKPAKEINWLADAIKDGDIDAFKNVFNFIKDKKAGPQTTAPHPKLDYLDDEGNSLLSISLEKQSTEISNLLFDYLLAEDDPILFAKNEKNQSLIWHAAKSLNHELLKRLLDHAEVCYKQNILKEKLWIEADSEGTTPIFAAMSTPDHKIKALSHLLETIERLEGQEELKNHLNLMNDQNGNTPLHIAFQKQNSLAIALLTKFGADWTAQNNDKKTPFDYFCELNKEHGYTLEIRTKEEFDKLNNDLKNKPCFILNENANLFWGYKEEDGWQYRDARDFVIPEEWRDKKEVFISFDNDQICQALMKFHNQLNLQHAILAALTIVKEIHNGQKNYLERR